MCANRVVDVCHRVIDVRHQEVLFAPSAIVVLRRAFQAGVCATRQSMYAIRQHESSGSSWRHQTIAVRFPSNRAIT